MKKLSMAVKNTMDAKNEHQLNVDEELRVASLELNRASERYQSAILARIAFRALLRQENNR